MSPELTRKELYELVWTKPRSQIAKELGVSDAWIGKMCRTKDVPAPPPGYWANLAPGSRRRRKYVKPPLPYSVVERIEEEHAELAACFAGFDPNDFEQPVPPPPVMPHTSEGSLARHRQLVDALPVPKATRGLHPIAQKLVNEDDRTASLSSPYSWEKYVSLAPNRWNRITRVRPILDAPTGPLSSAGAFPQAPNPDRAPQVVRPGRSGIMLPGADDDRSARRTSPAGGRAVPPGRRSPARLVRFGRPG